MPYVLKAYGKSAEKKLAKLAKISGIALKDDSSEIASNKFIAYIEELNRHFEIPTKITDLKEENIDKLAKHAEYEANPLYPVPKLMSKEELKEIYFDLLPNN